MLASRNPIKKTKIVSRLPRHWGGTPKLLEYTNVCIAVIDTIKTYSKKTEKIRVNISMKAIFTLALSEISYT